MASIYYSIPIGPPVPLPPPSRYVAVGFFSLFYFFDISIRTDPSPPWSVSFIGSFDCAPFSRLFFYFAPQFFFRMFGRKNGATRAVKRRPVDLWASRVPFFQVSPPIFFLLFFGWTSKNDRNRPQKKFFFLLFTYFWKKRWTLVMAALTGFIRKKAAIMMYFLGILLGFFTEFACFVVFLFFNVFFTEFHEGVFNSAPASPDTKRPLGRTFCFENNTVKIKNKTTPPPSVPSRRLQSVPVVKRRVLMGFSGFWWVHRVDGDGARCCAPSAPADQK